MSTVKISALPEISHLNANTAQTIFMGVDTVSGITGKFSGTVLAEGLYSHNVLNVGNNEVLLANVLGQFAGSSDTFVQLNLQNLNGNGSGDIVVTANNGTDTTYFIDMGMNGDLYSIAEYNSMKALDGYLVVQGDTGNPGGNLVIGTATPNKNVNIILGGTTEGDIFAQFIDETGFKMVNRPVIFQDGTSQNTAAAPFAYANAAFLKANSAYGSQNTTGTYANASFTKANAAFGAANSAGVYANTAADTAATAVINAATADSKATTAGNYANSAFLKANTPSHVANSAALYGNGAFTQANSAFTKANNALANTSGTFNGDLNVDGTIKIKNGPTFEYSPSASPAIWSITSSTPLGIVSDLNVTGNTAVNYSLIVRNSAMPGNTAFVSVIGSTGYATQPASNPGYMIHTTGIDGEASRIVGDAFSNTASHYSAFIGRRGRGTAVNPLPVQSGDIIARFAGNGFGDTKFSQFGDGRVEVHATATHTDLSKPTKIVFFTTPSGSNTATSIAEFNGNTATFTGYLNPSKGVVYTPRLPEGLQTTITIDYITDSVIKANCGADLTISHTNYTAGKVVEMWLVNTDNANHTITHGCAALRSTNKSTTATITAGSCMHLKFFSIDGDNANTFVSING